MYLLEFPCQGNIMKLFNFVDSDKESTKLKWKEP